MGLGFRARVRARVREEREGRVPGADVGRGARLVPTRRAQVLVHIAAALDGVGQERGTGRERARTWLG